jgi:uroporphyrinogen decarboxylase
MHNDLENFRATTAHRRPDRVLYNASFTPDLLRRVQEHVPGGDIQAHYGFARQQSIAMRRPADLAEIDYSSYYGKDELPEGTKFNGHGAAQVPAGFYHFWGYVSPLRNATNLAEIEAYPMDDMSDWDCSFMSDLVTTAHAEGKFTVGFVGHIFESAWQLRGMEPFMVDMIDQPAWAEDLLERIAIQNMAKATAFARAGVDMIRCGDDVATQRGMMFSPDLWRRLIHSRWQRIWAEVKRIHPGAKIWYHSDGNIADIIGDLVAAGVDVLNPLQPECLDFDRAYRDHGQSITFDGCVGTQSTMPFGTPAEVRERVKFLIQTYGSDGGLMLCPTHVLEPEVPIANIDAFADACREFG